jgi:hypothetical protein
MADAAKVKPFHSSVWDVLLVSIVFLTELIAGEK